MKKLKHLVSSLTLNKNLIQTELHSSLSAKTRSCTFTVRNACTFDGTGTLAELCIHFQAYRRFQEKNLCLYCIFLHEHSSVHTLTFVLFPTAARYNGCHSFTHDPPISLTFFYSHCAHRFVLCLFGTLDYYRFAVF